MLRQDMESIYATMILVHDSHRFHREQMMEQAENDRLVRSVRTNESRVHHAVLAWAGRRLVASGHYLLKRATPNGEMTLTPAEQR